MAEYRLYVGSQAPGLFPVDDSHAARAYRWALEPYLTEMQPWLDNHELKRRHQARALSAQLFHRRWHVRLRDLLDARWSGFFISRGPNKDLKSESSVRRLFECPPTLLVTPPELTKHACKRCTFCPFCWCRGYTKPLIHRLRAVLNTHSAGASMQYRIRMVRCQYTLPMPRGSAASMFELLKKTFNRDRWRQNRTGVAGGATIAYVAPYEGEDVVLCHVHVVIGPESAIRQWRPPSLAKHINGQVYPLVERNYKSFKLERLYRIAGLATLWPSGWFIGNTEVAIRLLDNIPNNFSHMRCYGCLTPKEITARNRPEPKERHGESLDETETETDEDPFWE